MIYSYLKIHFLLQKNLIDIKLARTHSIFNNLYKITVAETFVQNNKKTLIFNNIQHT